MDDAPLYDDGSDKENQTVSPNSPGKQDVRILPISPGSKEQRPRPNPFVDDSSDESDTGLRERPQGKIVSRMLGPTLDQDEEDEPEENPAGQQNSYERVKSQLFGGDASEYALPKEKSKQPADDASTIDEDKSGSGESAYERIKRQLLEGKSDDVGKSHTREKQPGTSKGDSADAGPEDMPQSDHDELALEQENAQGDYESLQNTNGLFVSPERAVSRHQMSTSPSPAGHDATSRLQELVARKREERLAREKAAGRASTDEGYSDASTSPSRSPSQAKRKKKQVVLVDSEGDSDKETGQKLTQQARPTRKASKRAIEEMNRETQRMSRNMQLTHQAKTKTKFSTADFFKRMNFRQPKSTETATVQQEPSSSNSHPTSEDAEQQLSAGTPPSSPPSVGHSFKNPSKAPQFGSSERPQAGSDDHSDREFPTLDEFLAKRPTSDAAKPPLEPGASNGGIDDETKPEKPSLRKFAKSAKAPAVNEDSEDDLEIVRPEKPSRLKALDNIPVQKASTSHAIDALRALAHLNGDDRGYKTCRGSMTATDLKQSLQRRARAQAHVERMEKIQALRDKGVIVQTAEEKEKDQVQLENMLDKARQEAKELAKQEKEAAKKDGTDNKTTGDLPDSEDEDEDWQEGEDDGDVELSGSDEEHEEDGEEEEDLENAETAGDADQSLQKETDPENPLIDEEAAEDQDEPEEAIEVFDGDNEESEDEHVPVKPTRSRKRKTVIDSDDEEDGPKHQSSAPTAPTTPAAKPVAADAFGFAQARPAQLGLSQVFAGTMAQTQTQGDLEGSIADTEDLPALPSPIAAPSTRGPENRTYLVQDSQNHENREDQSRNTTPAPSRFSVDAQTPVLNMPTQGSEFVEPSQDVGFQTNISPARIGGISQEPAGDHSTADTVMLPKDSPAIVKKRRLLRRQRPADSPAEDAPDTLVNASGDETGDDGNAFQIMRRAAEKPEKPAEYNKKKSEAKEMVQEQAEESEDEYAGLGGASDDESQGEADEEMKKMINDEDREALKERKLAAYYANKERADDEKLLERLYKDINNGGFRRKRGADMDLLESDDEEEAASRRRAAKQREFAKMRKALLADEKIGKIAENPKQQAFLQAIEDRADDDDLTFLDDAEGETSEAPASQADPTASHPLAPTTANSRKRNHDEYEEDGSGGQTESRPPPFMRRTKMRDAKPASLTQIRTTLSELLGDENQEPELIMDSQGGPTAEDGDECRGSSDGENEDETDDLQITDSASDVQPIAAESSATANKSHDTNVSNSVRRPRHPAAPGPSRNTSVIDRMALKRCSSSTKDPSDATGSINGSISNSRLAFQANPSNASSSFFKVPSLLRRATTNASNTSSSSTANSTSSSKSSNSGSAASAAEVKMGGTKKSSVNYYVREKERTMKVKEVERCREEERRRDGELRRRENARRGLGGLVGGKFN